MDGIKSSPEVVDAEATVLDTDIAALSASEEWLAQINERATLLAEQYRPHDIADEQDYKDSKRARADANREIKAIEQERMSMTAAIKRAVRDFEAGARRAIEPLSQIVEQYDEKKSAYEERWRTDRQVELAEEYEAIAPDLVPLVPFSRLLERFGNERGKGWLNRTTNVEAAKDMLAKAVETIAANEQTIANVALTDDEAMEVRADYFASLDFAEAMRRGQERRDQRERVARLEEERRRREEESRRLEEERRAAEEAAHVALKAGPAMVEMPIAPPDPEQFEPVPMAYEPPSVIAPTEVPHPWVIAIPSATKAQAQAVAEFMRSNGIAFERIYSGDMSAAYAKWSNENAR